MKSNGDFPFISLSDLLGKPFFDQKQSAGTQSSPLGRRPLLFSDVSARQNDSPKRRLVYFIERPSFSHASPFTTHKKSVGAFSRRFALLLCLATPVILRKPNPYCPKPKRRNQERCPTRFRCPDRKTGIAPPPLLPNFRKQKRTPRRRRPANLRPRRLRRRLCPSRIPDNSIRSRRLKELRAVI